MGRVTASQSPGFGLSRPSISGWRENVAQANTDGVLQEAQHDVIGVDNMMWGSDFATGAILTVDGGRLRCGEKVAWEHVVLEPVNRFAVAFAVRVVHRGNQVRRPTPSRTIRFSDHVDVRCEHAPVALDRFARDIWCIVSRR